MIYLLKSTTGEYEDTSTTNHGFFSSYRQAEQTLNKLIAFDQYLEGRVDDDRYYSVRTRAYKMLLGIDIYIDYTGVYWSIEQVRCLDLHKCKGIK